MVFAVSSSIVRASPLPSFDAAAAVAIMVRWDNIDLIISLACTLLLSSLCYANILCATQSVGVIHSDRNRVIFHGKNGQQI